MIVSEFKTLARGVRKSVFRIVSTLKATSINTDSHRLTIIAPHPDDEIFGCAGLISDAVARGCEVNIFYLSNGSGSHRHCCDISEDTVKTYRSRLAIKVSKTIGIKPERCVFFEGKDGHLPRRGDDNFTEFVDRIRYKMNTLKPDAVFCPHPFEVWSDHVATAELTRAALEGLYCQPALYYYCVWLWYNMPLRKLWYIDWSQVRILDINQTFYQKKRAVGVYLEDLAPCGRPWIGKLPKDFLKSFEWDKEVFFKVEY